jgi:hypothetical protein
MKKKLKACVKQVKEEGYFIDPSSNQKSGTRLCAFLVIITGIVLDFYLAYKGHTAQAVEVFGLLIGATWLTYAANSTARVIVTKGQPPDVSPSAAPELAEPKD